MHHQDVLRALGMEAETEQRTKGLIELEVKNGGLDLKERIESVRISSLPAC